MSTDPFDAIDASHREIARSALASALGARMAVAVEPLTGGASNASVIRVDAGGRSYLLRVEGPPSPGLRRNPYQYACLQSAAQAGLGPALHYLDGARGVALTDFIEQRPLNAYPGGADGLARGGGRCWASCRPCRPFPTWSIIGR